MLLRPSTDWVRPTARVMENNLLIFQRLTQSLLI